MTIAKHTPYSYGGPLSSAGMEAPLGQLDAAILAVEAGLAAAITTGSGASTTLTAQANAGQKNMVVASGTNFPNGALFWIGDPGGTHESGVIASGGGTGTLVAAVNLANTYAIGQPVSVSPIELVDARGGQASLGARISLFDRWAYDIRKYGALMDGVTDDRAAIQAANDAAAATGGGAVFVPPGTALSTGFTLSANIELRGTGPASIIKHKAGSSGALVAPTGINTAVRDLTIDGNRANQTVETSAIRPYNVANCAIERVTIKAVNGYGIYATDATRLTVHDCHVSDTLWTGIFVSAVALALSDIDIDGNTVDRSAEATAMTNGCIDIHGDPTFRIANVRVRANYAIMPTNPASPGAICIQLYGGIDRAAVTGNHTSGGSMGISLDHTLRSTCSANTVFGAKSYGIELAGSSYNTVSGNAVDGNALTAVGIQLDGTAPVHNAISGNTISRCVTYGVASTAGANFTSVSGNNIAHPANYAINLAASLDCTVSGNVLDGLGTGLKGLMCDSSYSIAITGNHFRNFIENGVLFFATTAVTFANISIAGNVFDSVNVPVGSSFAGGAAWGADVVMYGNPGAGGNYMDRLADLSEKWGTGTPEGVVTAGVGSVFHRKDGGASTSIYIKTSGVGNTGWTAK